MITRHLYAEFECDFDTLNDEELLVGACVNACKEAGATVLSFQSKKFDPQGVTVLVLLSESHLSLHTWPERKTAALDIFTCGEHTFPSKGYEYLLKELNATECGFSLVRRPV